MHPGAAVNRVTLLRLVMQTKLGPAKVRNRRILLVVVRPREGRLTERTPAVRPPWRERVLMPRSRPLRGVWKQPFEAALG